MRWLGLIVASGVIALGALLVAARFSDGPLGPIAGGPLVRGELVTTPEPDWTFAHDVATVEIQLLSPPRSRRTWILELDGKVYIVSLYMTSAVGRLWKQWPVEAQRNADAILRVDGKRYPRRLIRIQQGPLLEPLTRELSRKYAAATPADVESGRLWLFELAPPRADG